MPIRQPITKRTRLAAVMTAAVAVASVVVASPAHAKPLRAECSRVTNVGLTIRDGNLIKGSGSATLCGSGYLVVTVQRLRALGRWESVGTPGTSESGAPVSAIFNCSGSGTFTYRTEAYQRVPQINGRFISDYFNHSNKIRVSC
ncbi:hypothetical protein [Lentzea sp. NEAU-D7]|uniref:hypothetical protein n=1 Tax=Lentzea sp. NEAU-D7 TaxID=2994667 RepID=UPI00224B4EF4|nr:hypothetical protein [Lentzea sp. NEAU-D7]MCX2947898.1 hypothetical protein [Lentzea sp. NEAU-D7]